MRYDPAKIVTIMSERGMTQADLARASGLKQPSIHDLVHGITTMPKASTLIDVANALGVPLKAILKKGASKQGAEDLQEEMIAAFAALESPDQRAIIAAAQALRRPPKNK